MPDVVIAALFTCGPDGRVKFGWSSTPVDDAQLRAIATVPIRVSVYIMEAGVPYTLQVQPHPKASELTALGLGGNRDQYIAPTVRLYINAAGIPITEELA